MINVLISNVSADSTTRLLSDVAECVHNAEVRCAVGRDYAADHANDACYSHDDERRSHRHVHGDWQADSGVRHRFDDYARQRNPDQSSHHRDGDGFAQQQFEDAFTRKAEHPQNSNFTRAFADRHGHGVGDNV